MAKGPDIPAAASVIGEAYAPGQTLRGTDAVTNSALSILYIGHGDGTALDRANALRRIGHDVEHVSLRQLLPRTTWIDRVTWRLGGDVLSPWILRRLPRALKRPRYDLCYVDSGEWVTPKVIDLIRRYATKVVNYNIDDPLGKRDATRFRAYRQSVSFYDLCVVVRSENVAEARRLGARDVMRVYRSSDEVAHAPRIITEADAKRWQADVLFLGTWFPERGPFLVELVKLGVPLTIRGAQWKKAPEWPTLRPYFKGEHLYGDEYALALQCSRLSLGLLSKGNRDLHTTRSLEIPAVGGVLFAERTSEHLEMYVDGQEALFWSSAEECAAVCREALADEERRMRIAKAGHIRSMINQHHNEKVMRSIVERVFGRDR
jgi:spore maturation protein CgeB